MGRVRAAGEKVVVFSDLKDGLEVLHEATRREHGDAAVAVIYGTSSFADRSESAAACVCVAASGVNMGACRV
eukprot:4836430-Prymnesium_polylepis.1